MKFCPVCKENKPKNKENFHSNGRYLYHICKVCTKIKKKEKNKRYYANNKEKIKSHYSKPEVQKEEYFRGLKRKYGLSKGAYQKHWDSQAGLCKICNKPLEEKGGTKRTVVVDHCHDTGRVRGLLCHKCNTGLGMFNDNPDLVLLACDYLLDFKEIDDTKPIYED